MARVLVICNFFTSGRKQYFWGGCELYTIFFNVLLKNGNIRFCKKLIFFHELLRKRS